MSERYKNKGRECKVAGCERPASHRGFCQFHYQLDYNGGNWRSRSLRKHGLTQADFDAMSETQGGGCALCGGVNANGRNLSIDHDHSCCPTKDKSCGKCARGLLCMPCNCRLGLLEALLDADEWMVKAMNYLGRSDELERLAS